MPGSSGLSSPIGPYARPLNLKGGQLSRPYVAACPVSQYWVNPVPKSVYIHFRSSLACISIMSPVSELAQEYSFLFLSRSQPPIPNDSFKQGHGWWMSCRFFHVRSSLLTLLSSHICCFLSGSHAKSIGYGGGSLTLSFYIITAWVCVHGLIYWTDFLSYSAIDLGRDRLWWHW